MTSIPFVVLAYVVGSMSFAVLISWLFGLPDPRTYGSRNPGATNVLRTGRKTAAALTLLGDGAKGAVVVWLTRQFGPQVGLGEGTVAGAAVAAFAGHLYPVFFGFKGGKGVATAGGILLALSPWLALVSLAVFSLIIVVTRYVSLASTGAAVAAVIAAPAMVGWGPSAAAVAVMATLIVWRHRTNFTRLLAGQEAKIGARKPTPPAEQG